MEIILKMPVDEATIKAEIEKFSAEIEIRKTEIKMLAAGIKHYQSFCKHPGQKTGCNERDGNWAAPCPICGESR